MKNNIKHWRKKSVFTQAQLAEKIGVSRQTINAIEKGDYGPSTVLALKLSEVLGSSINDLFQLEKSDW